VSPYLFSITTSELLVIPTYFQRNFDYYECVAVIAATTTASIRRELQLLQRTTSVSSSLLYITAPVPSQQNRDYYERVAVLAGHSNTSVDYYTDTEHYETPTTIRVLLALNCCCCIWTFRRRFEQVIDCDRNRRVQPLIDQFIYYDRKRPSAQRPLH